MSENKEMSTGWTKAIFEDLLDYIQPTKFIVESTEYDDKYKTPVLTAGKSFIIGHTNETNGIFNKIPVIIFDDFTTAIKFVKFPFKVKSSAMKILSPVSKLVNIKYVFCYMQTLRVNADTHKRYWISHYSKLPVPLPPLSEQQRIVAKIEELFSSLDKGIESLKTAQQQLKVYRQAVLKWAFEGKLTINTHGHFDKLSDHGTVTSGADYLPVATSTGSVTSPVAEPVEATDKEGDLPQGDALSLPKGWKIVELKEVCEIKRGKSKHRPRNEPSLFGGKYPFIQTGDIRNAKGGYIKKFSQTYSEIGLQQSKLWAKGTLCITIAANIGETAILDLDACFPDSVVGLVCNEKMLLNKYTNYFFISHKSKLEELAPATAQKNINVDILEKVKIPLPPLAEQQTIVAEIESRLSVCDKIEESIEQSLKQSESLRQSILKKAFEGKLVPQDPSDEPASKLLERIKAQKEKTESKRE
ncbi:MAG: restriction endonuclease subunit S [Smithella sp.]|jgi:restriction endonuclease S subunit